jgi:hypothetical protein
MSPTTKKPKPTKAKGKPVKGRPKFTQAFADKVCTLILDRKTLNFAAKKLGVGRQTILDWLDQNPAFACQYARAREAQGDGFDDEIIETREKVANGDLDPNAGRVIIDSLKWQAGKRVPKRYGDRIAHVGPDDGAIKLEGKPPDTLETARWIADMLLTAEAAKAKADDDEGNQE